MYVSDSDVFHSSNMMTETRHDNRSAKSTSTISSSLISPKSFMVSSSDLTSARSETMPSMKPTIVADPLTTSVIGSLEGVLSRTSFIEEQQTEINPTKSTSVFGDNPTENTQILYNSDSTSLFESEKSDAILSTSASSISIKYSEVVSQKVSSPLLIRTHLLTAVSFQSSSHATDGSFVHSSDITATDLIRETISPTPASKWMNTTEGFDVASTTMHIDRSSVGPYQSSSPNKTDAANKKGLHYHSKWLFLLYDLGSNDQGVLLCPVRLFVSCQINTLLPGITLYRRERDFIFGISNDTKVDCLDH